MGQRPAHLPDHLTAPAYLSPSPPVPQPGAAPDATNGAPDGAALDRRDDGLDPTRYGDWERKGIAIDF